MSKKIKLRDVEKLHGRITLGDMTALIREKKKAISAITFSIKKNDLHRVKDKNPFGSRERQEPAERPQRKLIQTCQKTLYETDGTHQPQNDLPVAIWGKIFGGSSLRRSGGGGLLGRDGVKAGVTYTNRRVIKNQKEQENGNECSPEGCRMYVIR